jgi:hypothetical protein
MQNKTNKNKYLRKMNSSQALVSHSRDQDCGLKPAWANSSHDYLENTQQKKGWFKW